VARISASGATLHPFIELHVTAHEDAFLTLVFSFFVQIKIAKDMIEEFLLNNYIEEIEFAPNDKPALLMGGTKSVVSKLADEFDVDLNVSRSNYVIHARGKKENVLAAKKRLNQFLVGGDGHSVSKILVSEQAVGAVIGKGGSQIAKLEGNHNGLKVLIDRSSGTITLRGPEQSVQNSRVEIIKILSSVRIEESMPITPEQHAQISKPEVVRRVTSGIPVQVTVSDDAVKVRGIFADVRDTVALVKAHLTGVFEARVELDLTQFKKVSGAARDPSHFNRMKGSSNAEIDLDPANNSIVIHGKRANVKKAKILVMGFLDFILPSNFEHIKVPKVFHTKVANAAFLADVAALSGASVSLDRDLNSVSVQTKRSLTSLVTDALAIVFLILSVHRFTYSLPIPTRWKKLPSSSRQSLPKLRSLFSFCLSIKLSLGFFLSSSEKVGNESVH
jgi:hypothetical protein